MRMVKFARIGMKREQFAVAENAIRRAVIETLEGRCLLTTLPAPVAVGQGSTTAPGPVLDAAAPTFQWDAVTGVSGLTGYQIDAYDKTLGKSFEYQVGTSVTSYSAPSSVLVPGDDFVWNVRIIDGSTTGPESAYLNFVAPAAPTLPAPVATGPGSTTKPGPVLTTSTPTLTWDAVAGVSGLTGYQINLFNQTTSTSTSYQVGASDTSYTAPSSALVAGDTYVWNVRVLVGTESGPPSAYLNFVVPAAPVLPAPVATGPGSTVKPGPVLTTNDPTLTWAAVSGVSGLTGYQIYLTDETASKTYSYQVGASVTSYTVPSGTLAAGDTFVWNVRVLVGSQSGSPSSYFYFQTPAAVVTTLPAPVAIGQGSTTSPVPVLDSSSPTFQWNAVTGVSGMIGYQINFYNETTGKSYSYQVGTSVTSYSAPASALTPGDTYVWNVRVLVGSESGPPSAYLVFQTPPPVVLPAPVATGPGGTVKPGTVLTTSDPTLAWNAVTGVSGLSGYQIYLTDETLGKTFSYQVGASVTSFAVPAGTLAAGDTFVWNVRVLDGDKSGPPSAYLYFQTPSSTAGGSSSSNPPTVGTEIVADTEKLTRLEDEQHETVRSLKASTADTATYTTLLAKYDEWEKRIKSLKEARAALVSEV
jgi:hypothetical protein